MNFKLFLVAYKTAIINYIASTLIVTAASKPPEEANQGSRR